MTVYHKGTDGVDEGYEHEKHSHDQIDFVQEHLWTWVSDLPEEAEADELNIPFDKDDEQCGRNFGPDENFGHELIAWE